MTSTVDLVVPVKPLLKAKSRLRGAADGGIGEPRAHARLAMALARDTIDAVRAAPAVRHLLVISSDPVVAAELGVFGVDVMPDGPVPGLNRAYERGAALLRSRDPATAVGALQADLPALRPDELDDAIASALALFAAGARRAFVADAEGTGTTFLLAAPGTALDPRFGADSAHRHEDPAPTRWRGLARPAPRRRHRRRPPRGRRPRPRRAHQLRARTHPGLLTRSRRPPWMHRWTARKDRHTPPGPGAHGQKCVRDTGGVCEAGPAWTGRRQAAHSSGTWHTRPAMCARDGRCVRPVAKRPERRPPTVHPDVGHCGEHGAGAVGNNRGVGEDTSRTQTNGSGEVTTPRRARTGRSAPRPSTRRVSSAGSATAAVAETPAVVTGDGAVDTTAVDTTARDQPGPTAPPTGARTATAASAAAVPVSPPARTLAPVSELPDDRYLNRELSWLDFNARVLALAEDASQPLLERAKFLAIFASNLDEFYMVRVAGLKRRDETGLAVRSADGLTPREQLARIADPHARRSPEAHARVFLDHVRPELAAEGIRILRWTDLSDDQRARLSAYFSAQVFPVLTPLAVDPAHPFPYISGLSLNLAVTVRDPDGRTERFARVKVPNNVPRLVRVATERRHDHVPADRGPDLGPPRRAVHRHGGGRGARVPGHPQRRPRGRGGPRRGPAAVAGARARPAPVRPAGAPRGHRHDERARAGAAAARARRGPARRRHGARPARPHRAVGRARGRPARPQGRRRSCPATHPAFAERETPRSVFATLREGDVLVHHPYDSFSTSVQRFIEQAAADPNVLAIKQTLYRTSGDSPHRRRPDRRRRGRQAGRRAGGDQGAVRRAGQHPLGA